MDEQRNKMLEEAISAMALNDNLDPNEKLKQLELLVDQHIDATGNSRDSVNKMLESIQLNQKNNQVLRTVEPGDKNLQNELDSRVVQTKFWKDGLKLISEEKLDQGFASLVKAFFYMGQSPPMSGEELVALKFIIDKEKPDNVNAKILLALCTMGLENDLDKVVVMVSQIISTSITKIDDFTKIGLYFFRAAIYSMLQVDNLSLADLNSCIDTIESSNLKTRYGEALISRIKLYRMSSDSKLASEIKSALSKVNKDSKEYYEILLLKCSSAFENGKVSQAKSAYEEAQQWKKDHKFRDPSLESLEKQCEANLVSIGSTKVHDRECACCKKVTPGKPMMCSRCKSIVYCGRDCQVKDWKTHKKNCKPDNNSKLKEHLKNEAVANKKPLEFPSANTTPPDLNTTGDSEFNQAVSLLKKEDYSKSAEQFCYALFLDQSLDAKLKSQGHLTVILKKANKENCYVEILKRFLDGTSLNYNDMLRIPTDIMMLQAKNNESEETQKWQMALIRIFTGRQLSLQAAHLNKPSLSVTAFNNLTGAYELIGDRGYLTLLFEMGYAHRDQAKFSEARKFYNEFLKRAPKNHPLTSSVKSHLQMVNQFEQMMKGRR